MGLFPGRYQEQADNLDLFIISGFIAAVAGIILTSKSYLASPIAFERMEMRYIAACVIGGASISGVAGEHHWDYPWLPPHRANRQRDDPDRHLPILGKRYIWNNPRDGRCLFGAELEGMTVH